MSDVKLNIAGREYVVTCRDGEEDRLTSLAAIVDEKAKEAGGSATGLNESRQLLFASLLLADQIAEHMAGGPADAAASKAVASPTTGSDIDSDQVAATLEKLATRLELVADKLEQ